MIRKSFALTLAALWLVAAASVHAQVTVKDPWVRATVPQQKATGAFMQLTAAKEARLLSASSPVAGVVEVHEMVMVDNVMKMRALPNGLDLPAGKTVDLKPGGYHIMLMDLKGEVKEGSAVPVTLVVQGKDGKKDSIEVKATVRAVNATAAAGDHGAMKH